MINVMRNRALPDAVLRVECGKPFRLDRQNDSRGSVELGVTRIEQRKRALIIREDEPRGSIGSESSVVVGKRRRGQAHSSKEILVDLFEVRERSTRQFRQSCARRIDLSLDPDRERSHSG